jgi:AraC-like DNA-binding protein
MVCRSPTKIISMSVKFPYRAVICGEEHIVKGWRGRKIITDKGSFFVGHIYGDWQIQSHRLFEVALLESDEKGGWLLNGKEFSSLNSLPMGLRLSSLPSDENLRVYKDRICAVAWLDKTGDAARVTELLDEIISFWRMALLPSIKSDEEPSLAKIFGQLGYSLHMLSKCKELLAAWSNPVWLSEFRHAAQKIPISPQQKQLAEVATELHKTKEQLRKSQAAASDNLKEALSKWMRFDPPRMSADTKARIEKAVKMYLTDPDKHSLKKIADEFNVSRTTVSKWFSKFANETGYKVVTHQRHESVSDHLKADSVQDEEE